MEAARLVDLRQIPQGNQEAEKLAFGQRVADAVVTLVPDYGLVLPLQATASATGTTGTALPYQSVVEVHNRLVVVIFSEDLRSESGYAGASDSLACARYPYYVDCAGGRRNDQRDTSRGGCGLLVWWQRRNVIPAAGRDCRSRGLRNAVVMPTRM
jgi:hypothetical protein